MNFVTRALALALISTGSAALAQDAAPAPAAAPAAAAPAPAAKSSNVMEPIVITNSLVNGKKTWQPAEIKLKAGRKYQLEFVNTLADPHGFRAPGVLKEPVVVGGKETKRVAVEPTTPGTYKFDCQLHPAHVGGHIIVD